MKRVAARCSVRWWQPRWCSIRGAASSDWTIRRNCRPNGAGSWPNAFASTRWPGPSRKSTPAASTPGIFIRPAARPWSRRLAAASPPGLPAARRHRARSPIEQKALIHGDARSVSIAAASILAKVDRDRRMEEFDQLYPQYGLAQNKGYGTPEHLEALRRHGPTPLHRFSYAPVREARCWAAGARQQTPLPLARGLSDVALDRGRCPWLPRAVPRALLRACYPLRHHPRLASLTCFFARANLSLVCSLHRRP